jgi:phage baseplate assembly protein W
LADQPPCGNRNGANFGDKVVDGHHLVAMGARSSGAKPTAKNAALVTALLTKEPRITLRALVDDGRLWETAGKAQLELVGRSLTEAEATLAAGV